MDIKKLREALASAVDILGTPETIAEVTNGDGSSEGGDTVINTSDEEKEEITKTEDKQLPIGDNTQMDVAYDIPDESTMTSNEARYQELAMQIAQLSTEIKNNSTAIATLAVDVGKLKNSIININDEFDNSIKIPAVRTVVDSIARI